MQTSASLFGRVCTALVGSTLLILAGRTLAEPPRAPGSSTGDGSTPFTGLAQAPEANLFVGAATTSIPIEVPPGRKSITPKLALTYSSSGGPSPYGYGWDLPLGKIQRSTKHGVLSCSTDSYRNDFVVVLSGSTVECTLDSSDRCNATVEGAFLRIQYGRTDNHWEIWDRSGLHYFFGEIGTARTGSDVGSLFVASAPGQPCQYTYAWALTRIEDPNHNYLTVTYLKDSGVLYPDSIQYGGNSAAGLGHLFEIKFFFYSTFVPVAIQNMGGFRAAISKRLSMIEVRYLVEEGRSRKYLLDIESTGVGPANLGVLASVTLLDSDSHALARSDGLPAASTTFLYRRNGPYNSPGDDRFAFGAAQNATKPALSVHPTFGRWTDESGNERWTNRDIFDVNGDGYPDLVDIPDTCGTGGHDEWNVYFGSKSGFSTTVTTWHDPSLWCRIRHVTLRGQGGSVTVVDTLDLNGDGIVDLVDATTDPWSVYYGHGPSVGDNSWGFRVDPLTHLPAPWDVPREIQDGEDFPLRKSIGSVWFAGWIDSPGTADVQDLIDMNGDGLLDIVFSPHPFPPAAPLKVWLNKGDGFAAQANADFWVRDPAIRFTTGSGRQVIGFYDINGDGLPDQITTWDKTLDPSYPGIWRVHLNIGNQLSNTEEIWGMPYGRCLYDRALRVSDSSGNVLQDFFDINGDGLPDVVDVCDYATTSAWNVFLNKGEDFALPDSYRWPSPVGNIRACTDRECNATTRDTFDIDGDGLPDLVDFNSPNIVINRNAGGAWCASANANGVVCGGSGAEVIANPDGGRPYLLEQMENGLGGTTTLEYRPSTQWDNTDVYGVPHLPFVLWTVTSIDQDDGLCDAAGGQCASAGSHTLSTDLAYAYGLFSPGSREFRGFGTVEQYDADGNLRTTWFHQDAATKGKIYGLNAYAAGPDPDPYLNLLVYTTKTWGCYDLSGAPQPCVDTLAAGQRQWVRLLEEDRYDTTNHGITKRVFTKNDAWDQYGNVTQSHRAGMGTTGVYTYTTYAARDDDTGYIVDKPEHVWVKEGTTTLEEKWFGYDTAALGLPSSGPVRGNVTRVYSWLDRVIDSGLPTGTACPQTPQAGLGTCVTTSMAYDEYGNGAYGNLTSVTDANNHTTTTAYDTVTHIYPYRVIKAYPAIDATTQEVATWYDPACGKLLWQTVTYPGGQNPGTQARTENRYDSFCRVEATALPYETLDNPHRTYTYYLGAPYDEQTGRAGLATDIRVAEVEPWSPDGEVRRDELFDALGRHLQTQRDGVVDGVYTRGSGNAVVEGTTTYGARGNVAQRFAPFTVAQISTIVLCSIRERRRRRARRPCSMTRSTA